MASQAINLGGQPTKYKARFAGQAKALCRLGATDLQLADCFGVTEQTVNNWKIAHPKFFESIKLGKAAIDSQVERSLYRKATGFTFESEKVFCSEGQVIRAPIREFVPPSDTAMIFWLKNRKPEQWRDRADLHITGSVDFSAKLAEARERVIEAQMPKRITSGSEDVTSASTDSAI
jgi:hypothetical protein